MLGRISIVVIALLALAYTLHARADSLLMSTQQMETLKQQYLSLPRNQRGPSGATSNVQADDIAEQQRAVQPQTAQSQSSQFQPLQATSLSVSSEPSAIEASMRARLDTNLQSGIKSTLTGRQEGLDSSTNAMGYDQRDTQVGQRARRSQEGVEAQGTQGSMPLPGTQDVPLGNLPGSTLGGAQYGSDPNAGFAGYIPGKLKNADLVKADKTEQRDMANSRLLDLNLRSSWEHFLESQKVRGVDSNLSQYGYELFAGAPSTFAPAVDIPVPPEYVLGPGDELQMQFYGSRDDTMSLVIDRNGVIQLPKVGSLNLVGLSFVQAKALIAEQVRKKMMGVTASVTMGQLRSIRVFVLGDAVHPGSYLISGLSTMTHAMFAAGGISKNGSLRNIQLKRNGKVVKELDLYEFLLKGNSRGDERLLPGDVIFIPPIGEVVGVAGQTTRPAIYELRGEKYMQDVAALAGGMLPDADLKHIQIDRLSAAGDRHILDLNMQQQTEIQNGDILMVFAIPGIRTDTVSLLGSIKRPGKYGFAEGMKISSLLGSAEDLLPGAFLDYALIQRTEPLSRGVSTLRVSLEQLLVRKNESADVALQADDQIYVFAKASIEPLNVVSISGQVVNPGDYPYIEKMHLVDLLFAAGGPVEQSYLKVAEVTRYEVLNGRRESKHFEVNLVDAIGGKADANIELLPHDELLIRTISNWRNAVRVNIEGEVMYPGTYPVAEGERLSDVLSRVGGYTRDAYLRAAVFTRESVRTDQQKQIDELALRTEAELTVMENTTAALKDDIMRARQQAKLVVAKRAAEQIKAVQATGRIVIELADIAKLKGSPFDLTLRDGDRLYVPKRPDEVLVLGEVYNQTAFIYREHVSSKEYLDMAGGPTRNGDASHTYVVRANGMLDVVDSGWFGGGSVAMGPGDTIVVPQSTDQFNIVDSTLDWTRVMMQVGVSLASMKTIGIFQ